MTVQIVFAHGMSASHLAPFGSGDELPWKFNPDDLAHFKNVTHRSVLLMGAKTFESLPCKLPNRPHVVLSTRPIHELKAKNGDNPDLVYSGELPDVINQIGRKVYSADEYTTISIVGGAGLIEQALPFADVVYKSCIYECDKECDVRIDLDKVLSEFPRRETLSSSSRIVFIERLTR